MHLRKTDKFGLIKDFFLALTIYLLAFTVEGQGVRTVVIDAGHGGKDPGCHGSFIKEKEVCLKVALALGKQINEYYPEVKVVYTRQRDEFIELYRRAQIANEAHADLFICIHVNSAGSASAHGAETYVLGLHRTEDNLRVAKRENASVGFETDVKKNYEGFDPNSDEGNIIFSMFQSAYLNQSLEFAGLVQHRFEHHAKRHNRGVRQAGFLVLVKTAMPSVLIETGFATHPGDEAFLGSAEGVRLMSESIFLAFADYKKSNEGKAYSGLDKPHPFLNHGTRPSKEHSKPTVVNTAEPTQESKRAYFSVQFLSSKTKFSDSDARFSSLEQVHSLPRPDGWIAYLSGQFMEEAQAKARLNELKSKGYSDAFLVGVIAGVKSSLDAVRATLKKKK
ncbi:MAG: N-acetylmuramoyl-L-alanine amidase [Bacteroidetes bacterium]|nr:N-acetylmuramoyl-L-alanine amidase [Bacteroidota bacterium]